MTSDPYINIHTHRPVYDPQIVSVTTCMLGEPGQTCLPPCAAGIHPWSLERLEEHTIEHLLADLETLPGLSAIGEIGLDHFRPIDPLRQLSIFKRQLTIASNRRLPVILHSVRAWDDTLSTLEPYRLTGVLFHGFTGNRQQAEQILRKGYYLSFGTRSLHSPKTIDALRTIPLGQLFLETDDSSDSIRDLYTTVANLLEVPIDSLRHTLYKNYKRWIA